MDQFLFSSFRALMDQNSPGSLGPPQPLHPHKLRVKLCFLQAQNMRKILISSIPVSTVTRWHRFAGLSLHQHHPAQQGEHPNLLLFLPHRFQASLKLLCSPEQPKPQAGTFLCPHPWIFFAFGLVPSGGSSTDITARDQQKLAQGL